MQLSNAANNLEITKTFEVCILEMHLKYLLSKPEKISLESVSLKISW